MMICKTLLHGDGEFDYGANICCRRSSAGAGSSSASFFEKRELSSPTHHTSRHDGDKWQASLVPAIINGEIAPQVFGLSRVVLFE